MDLEYEPMDVDLSGNSIHHIDAMDISYIDLDRSTIPEIKIKQEPIETDRKDYTFDSNIQIVTPIPTTKRFTIKIPQRKSYRIFSNTALSVIFTFLSLITLITYHILKFECSEELNLEMLKTSLNRHVVGQTEAIESIIDSLEEQPLQSPHYSKILFLYGGTGVGKTLTISLILENLYHYANIFHYTMPSVVDTFSSDLMLGQIFCSTSIIVVDDLKTINMNVKEHIKKIIEKSESLRKNTTILLVFNCDTINDHYIKKCDDSFHLELQEYFKDIKVLKKFIKFNLLTEDHLRKCVEKEIGGKTLNEQQFKNILKHFNVSVDGCKGVYTKIKLLNIK